MKILEKEIFNFIFFPEALDKEKFLFLSKTDLFENELELLKNIKEKYEQNLSSDLIEKIKSKISELGSNGRIRLFKKNPKEYNTNQMVLAAASHLKNNKQKIETFEDENSLYLIKVIKEKELTKMFLFTRDNKELKKYKLRVEPSGQNYSILSSNEPIIISEEQDITGISIISLN